MRAVIVALAAVAALVVLVGVGGYLALRRGDIPYETLDTRYGSEDSQFLDLGQGLVVHYRDQGAPAARPIMLVHGYSASLVTWSAWEAELAGAGYRVVSLDLPGHGLTRTPPDYAVTMDGYADLIETVAQRLGLPGVILAGSSMGGHVAWRTALRHPARVDALVLVGAAGWADPQQETSDDGPIIFRLLRDPIVGPILLDLDSTALTRQGLQASFADPSLATEDMVERYVELSRAPEHRNVLMRIITGDLSEGATPELMARITVPTLVMHGEQDRLVPVRFGRRYLETIPGAEGAIYADAGHLPQEEIAEKSVTDVKAFLLRHGLDRAAMEGAPLVAAGETPPAARPLEGVY
jgi:pimeloyl-ACP methyl ester carboxylesterase